MLSPTHAPERAWWAAPAGDTTGPLFDTALLSELRGSIVSKGTLYVGVLVAAVWNMFAAGSPLWSLTGVFTLLVNIGVAAAFIWILLEPPYLYTARRHFLRRDRPSRRRPVRDAVPI